MTENLNQNVGDVKGKQLGIAGFVLSLVTLLFASWIAVMAAAAIVTGGSGWLMYLWLVLAIVSVVLSAMGMSKLGKTGGKKGLAIAGLVIGIVSVIYCAMLAAGLSVAANSLDSIDSDEFRDAMNQYDDLLEESQN